MVYYKTGRLGRARYAFCPMDAVQSVSVGLWFGVGSRFEPDGLHGGAHFLEHMLFKGTGKRNALAISREIESKGGDINAFTSEEMTCYYARIGADHLDLVLDVLFDMLWGSKFPAIEVERERGVILEEIRMYEDQPHYLVVEKLNEALWPGNSLGFPIAGTPDSVSAMKRSSLLDFWKRNYCPSNLTIAIAGAFDSPEVSAKIEQYVKACTRNGLPARARSVGDKMNGRFVTVAVPRPVQQCSLALGIRGYPRSSQKRYTEKVLSVILGENMSSRLFQTLREKHGLAYSIHCSTQHFKDSGAFYLQAGVDPGKMEKALDVTAREFARIARKPPSSIELRRAKDYILGQMKLSMESTSNRMMWLGESVVGLGRVLNPSEIMAEIEAVTADQVSRVAAELFRPGRMVLACVGPDLNQKQLLQVSRSLRTL